MIGRRGTTWEVPRRPLPWLLCSSGPAPSILHIWSGWLERCFSVQQPSSRLDLPLAQGILTVAAPLCLSQNKLCSLPRPWP